MIIFFLRYPVTPPSLFYSSSLNFPADSFQLFSIRPAKLRYHTYYSLIGAVLIV